MLHCVPGPGTDGGGGTEDQVCVGDGTFHVHRLALVNENSPSVMLFVVAKKPRRIVLTTSGYGNEDK